MGIAASPLLDGEERLVGAVESLRDLTRPEQSGKQLEYLHDHDPLTGLHNRMYLLDRIRLMAEEGGERGNLGLIRCSVNGLQLINQNLGDEIGDRVLIAAASVLQRSFGPGTLLARVGGNEFIVMLPEADEATVESGRLRIQQVLAEHNQIPGGLPLNLSLECCVTSPTSEIG
jgi:diguanylate cyclase (GGDEF)-like protein